MVDYSPDVDMQSKEFKFLKNKIQISFLDDGSDGDLLEWYPSQVKGPVDDEVQEGKHFLRIIFLSIEQIIF